MFNCGTCQKSFTSRSSLRRHEHNHEATGRHKCTVCDVDFYRHDLLVRHQSIHQAPNAASTEMSTNRLERRRSRTACEQCRNDRAKCSGRNPCTRCIRKDKTCYFPQSKRVAQIGALSGEWNMLEDVSSDTLQNDVPGEGRSSDNVDAAVPLDLISHFTPPAHVEPVGINSADDPVMTPQNLAWPWIHEDLFLQDVINLDWYQLSDLTAATSGNLQYQTEHELGLNIDFDSADGIGNIIPNDEGVTYEQTDTFPGEMQRECSLRDSLVSEIVSYAFKCSKNKAPNQVQSIDYNTNNHTANFQSFSSRLESTFGFDTARLSEGYDFAQRHVLDVFVELYLEHFWILWPLFPKYVCSPDRFQPLLYLTLVSIGAMYGGKDASHFGAILHNKLREVLAKSFLGYEFLEPDALALGQARSLTQAAALYFGQRKAFSYAQHIGSVLVAQARKMDLFTSGHTKMPIDKQVSDDNSVNQWIRRECRKRLAYAIMRLEMYTSVLQSTRPLVSAEEMDIYLPCSRFLWHTRFEDSKAFAAAINQEHSDARGSELWFSDLLRIAIDPCEKLPMLDSLGQELLMNALQENVWSACNATSSLSRLTKATEEYCRPNLTTAFDNGLHDDCNEPEASNIASGSVQLPTKRKRTTSRLPMPQSLEDHVARHSRSMSSLLLRREAVTRALRKWQCSCLTSGEVPTTVPARSSLLSCLLLYHLSFMRLHSSMDLIHSSCCMSLASRYSVSCRNDLPKYNFGPNREEIVRNLKLWSQSDDAVIALQHAIMIFELLQYEARRPTETRARVNFLTLIGLYHSAALVWTIAGTRTGGEGSSSNVWRKSHDGSISNNHSDGSYVLHLHPLLSSSSQNSAGRPSFLNSNQNGSRHSISGLIRQREASEDQHQCENEDREEFEAIEVVRTNSAKLMEAFGSLFGHISPAWALRSSFSAAVRRLATVNFSS